MPRFFDLISSTKLTIVCLAAAMVLVFVGTLAQVDLGARLVQERYFQSMLVWWSPEFHGFRIPVLPGGHLLGLVLLANLLAAQFRRFGWNLRNMGLHLIHGGIVIMLAGTLLSEFLSVESFIQISQGETKNYSEDSRLIELTISDETISGVHREFLIPEARLRRSGTISMEDMPFMVTIRRFYENSRLQKSDLAANSQRAADHGIGAQVSVSAIPRSTTANERDLKSAVIEFIPLPNGKEGESNSLGTWLVADSLTIPQSFSFAGRLWRFEMRSARYVKPYRITLQKFTHERYPGTGIPKKFASQITLVDPMHAVNRDVVISMNRPFRYGGETYYQSGFGSGDQSSILQVVSNPGFFAPYIACGMISLGLLVQFCRHLAGFTLRSDIPRKT